MSESTPFKIRAKIGGRYWHIEKRESKCDPLAEALWKCEAMDRSGLCFSASGGLSGRDIIEFIKRMNKGDY